MSNYDRKYVKILGINVTSTSADRVLSLVRSRIKENKKFYIVTPNPEIVLAAQKDLKLAMTLNKASISLVDGVGLSQASKFLTLPAPRFTLMRLVICLIQGFAVGLATFFAKNWLYSELAPIKGRRMFLDLIRLANKKGWKVFFLGGRSDEASEAARKLKQSYKKIRIGSSAGPILNRGAEPLTSDEVIEEKRVVKQINDYQPDLLFIGMEAPKQEKWLGKWLPKLNVGGAMVVGGTFRYIAGYSPLPPKWLANSGLEWIWRLLTEPYRLRRIINAWPVFPVKVFLYKMRN
jgi:N-acetylglucosaminyldiphosphoundecaprenol N-acetyl-beta-D-mannosaminyltransferase